jgi:hypothetical protein
MRKITIWTNFQRIEELFTQQFFRIPVQGQKAPDPGVKKAPDLEHCKKKIMWLWINAITDNTFNQYCGSAMFIPDPSLILDWYQRI